MVQGSLLQLLSRKAIGVQDRLELFRQKPAQVQDSKGGSSCWILMHVQLWVRAQLCSGML